MVSPTPSPTPPALDRRDLLGALLLLAAVVLVFARVAGFDFLLYDDERYLLTNPVVHRGLDADSWVWAWSTLYEGMYQPLTWITHLVDVSLYGFDPAGHHVGNLVLHALNVLLVGWVLRRATGRRGPALVVALLFALHPLQVQSVAWIAERKGLLAAAFGLLALDRYTVWARSRRRGDLLSTHLLLAASLLSKPVLVPLPVVLLVWDRWPLGRAEALGRRLVEKAGLFVLAAAAAVMAVVAQGSAAALSGLHEVGPGIRGLNALVAYLRTLRRVFWPNDLAAYHPFRFDTSWVEGLVAIVVLAGSLALAWRWRRTVPALLTGWIWWVVIQLPTVNLVQFGVQGTADRFSYLPLLGILLALVFGAAHLLGTGRRDDAAEAAEADADRTFPGGRTRLPVALSTVAVLLAGVATSRALPPWRDTISLFEHNLEVTGGSALVHLNLGMGHENQGNVRKALEHYNKALLYAPHSATVLFHSADALYALGNYEAALGRYAQGLQVDATNPRAYLHSGTLLLAQGNVEEAGRAFYRGMQLAPKDPELVLGMADVMEELGRVDEQVGLMQRALELDPGLPGVRTEMAWIHATTDVEGLRAPRLALRLAEVDWEESQEQYYRALEVMAAARAALGDHERAALDSDRAERLARRAGQEQLADDIATRRALYLPEPGPSDDG